jgi:hypothetical protein
VLELTPEERAFLTAGTRTGKLGNGVPGELAVRLRPTKVISDFDMTG